MFEYYTTDFSWDAFCGNIVQFFQIKGMYCLFQTVLLSFTFLVECIMGFPFEYEIILHAVYICKLKNNEHFKVYGFVTEQLFVIKMVLHMAELFYSLYPYFCGKINI